MAISTLFRPGSRNGSSGDLTRLLGEVDNPIRAALDCLYTNCMIADLDLNLVFVNAQARKTLDQLAPAVKATFGVRLEDLLGGSIHRFHKDPARIERILRDPSALPRTAVFNFGGISLRTQISAIVTADGVRYGYIVAWDNISERNAKADEAFRAIEAASGVLTQATDKIVDGTRESSVRTGTAAAATQELRAAVAEIATSSAAAAEQVRGAVAASNESLQTLRDLQRSSTEIGDFLRLITGVAEQTKMLALNATIEAARAGTAGKGFAVVADEVKHLAGTTSASISDIEARIEAIQRASDEGVKALARIDELVTSISESQETVAAAIEEQSSVTAELAEAITGIADIARASAAESELVAGAIGEMTEGTRAMHRMIIES